ncbi:hypothetical protein FHS21_005663 [Phyllobacterium trifolii]|uniref:Uncharacterized protein n=1 Tax=Phyllobacterium trifolii TaxID=300193 RepID=A0A839UKR7_9HYPH|nr:hypothetical protein [Phyllobacterium trifolii]MBB3149211.1 hypothetical protein [Phyllobacterium trifolii]
MNDMIDIVESLKIQRDQLRRLLDEQIRVSEAPKATADERASQASLLKSIISELEQLIQQISSQKAAE